jgi:hypothetical protein
VGQAHGAGGRGVSTPVPQLWWRHPIDRLHHGAGGDGRQEPAYFEPEVRKRAKARMASPVYRSTAARHSRPWPAH